MKALLADLRHATRLYRGTPGSSLIAVAALAIGMAFVAAFFSLYVDLLLRPPAGFEPGGRFVRIGLTDGRQSNGLSFELMERIGEDVAALEVVAGVLPRTQAIGPDREQSLIEAVTREFFDGIRPRLELGRGFTPAEHQVEADPVVVISYRYWQEQFGGDPEVIGRLVGFATENRQSSTSTDESNEPDYVITDFRIVGVMAEEIDGVLYNGAALWVPYERAAALFFGEENLATVMRQRTFQSFGRLSDGVSAEALASQLNARYLDSREELRIQPGMRFDTIEGLVLNMSVQREMKRQLQLFLAGSVLLAVVAACNVSLFLLARAPGRRRELAIRLAVGAPDRRLVRQLVTESSLIVVVAGIAGLAISVWFSSYLSEMAFLRRAEWSDITLFDWQVLSVVGAFLLLLALTVSLAPLLGLRRFGIAQSSRLVAARATPAQRIAGTVQVAIAGAIGGAAIAFGWYLAVLMFGNAGYETRNLHVASFNLSLATNANFNVAVENAFVENARRRVAIESLPGVTAATSASPVPGGGGRAWSTIPHPDDPLRRIRVFRGVADENTVDVLGYRLAYGRAPELGEIDVALINQALAREFFGRENVVGESLPIAIRGGQSTVIVGVLEDLSFDHPTADVEPYVFLTSNPFFFFNQLAVIETELTAGELQLALEQLIDSGEFEMELGSVQPLNELRSNLIAPDRARGLLTIFTAALVVALAALGFFGTLNYLVAAGRREYAIRSSLGAGPRALGRLVFARGVLLGLPGIVVGALLAYIVVAWLRGDFLSAEVAPGVVTVAVVALLGLLLLLASQGPARRARRTEPAPLLRQE